MTITKRILTLGAVLAITVATGGVANAAGSETGPTGATRTVDVRTAGFSVEIPEPWVVFDSTKAESRAQFDAAVASNPELAQFSSAAASGAEHTALEVVDPSPAGGQGAYLTVQFYKGQRVTEPVSLVRAEFQQTDVFDDVSVRAAKLAGVRAVRARCALVMGAGAADRAELLVYELVGPKGLLVVSLAWSGNGPIPSTVRDIVASVRLAR